MPVTGLVDEQPVSGVMIPVTAFIDDSRTGVYIVSNGIARTHTVSEVKDDGRNAIVTGLDPNTVVVANVAVANVGNGDRVATASSPGPSPTNNPAAESPSPANAP
jgi:hypothetical protein